MQPCFVLRSKPISAASEVLIIVMIIARWPSSVEAVDDHAVLVGDIIQYQLRVVTATLAAVPHSVAQVDDHTYNHIHPSVINQSFTGLNNKEKSLNCISRTKKNNLVDKDKPDQKNRYKHIISSRRRDWRRASA